MRFVTAQPGADRSALGPRIRVIGAGLSRCATSSLQAALETPSMGYFPCMHMEHVVPHSWRSQIIIDAMQEEDTQRRRKLLHRVFDGYEATTDFPGFWFIDDLMDMYPDAPIVLNQRKGGGNAWFRSFEDNIGFFRSWTFYLICFPFRSDRLHWTMHRVATRTWDQKFGVGVGPEFYDAYQEFVLREARKRNREVLVWRAEDGWEPLCDFLGKEAPKDEPFPWVNDAVTVQNVKQVLVARGILSWAAIFGGFWAAWTHLPLLAGFVSTQMSQAPA
ncbi:putative tpr repeat containing protein [Hirsutella rhossiliensis]|uniref:Tpr repeat containing protein n=1 Tax=Hirsutella rhossiliensis TaxID=111463 RepID=A0A9P8SGW2_9HYPO|nr:putative tpr repeat containing protein [Hirsutella rhossiliensis]KAH0961519.1 putative tpr repeat containing protein [Hirsutella rhossiliensis]